MIPGNPSTLGSAAAWLEAAIHGPVVTSVAVLAIAGVGFAMLRGQLSIRRAAIVASGCFIAFGAPSIARSLAMLAQSQSNDDVPVIGSFEAPSPPAANIQPPAPTSATEEDPYAGASVRSGLQEAL